MPLGSSEGQVAVDGGNVWYRIVGDAEAPPVIVLHGGPGFPSDYLETLEWLAVDRRVVFYDQLGCGRSPAPQHLDLLRIDRFIRELQQIRSALNLDTVHVFGHSWGSMLATDYLLTQPAGVLSVVLASPVLSITRYRADVDRLRMELPPDVQEELLRHESDGTTRGDEYQRLCQTFYSKHICRLERWPDSMMRALDQSSDFVYERMWGPSEMLVTGILARYEREPRLGEIKIPVLLTCGRFDEATPEASRSFQKLFPNARLAVFENSAHMPHLEESEAYLATCREFFGQVDRDAGIMPVS